MGVWFYFANVLTIATATNVSSTYDGMVSWAILAGFFCLPILISGIAISRARHKHQQAADLKQYDRQDARFSGSDLLES